MQASEDWQLWKLIIGAIWSALSGAAVGGWVGRGMVEDVRQKVALSAQRIDALEAEQSKCQSMLKEEIREIVQQVVDRQALARAEQMGEIRTELAVITALHGETQQDVKAIFARLDRRKSEMVINHTGERRDQT